MRLVKASPAFTDERGEIIDLIEDQTINAVTLVTIKKGATRGNHFHRETIQWNYLVSGVVTLHTQIPGEERRETKLVAGDLAEVGADERHAFVGVEDASMMVFTRGPRGGKEYETDTFRMDPPLVARNG